MDKEKVIKQYQIPNRKAFCIYALYSDYDNKYFVGLTSDIRKRGLLLIYNLLSGYCTNQKLQSAFSRHPKSFHFLVLEENSDPLAAFDHANKIVQTLDTIRNGFNLVPIKKPRHAGGYSDYELTHGIDVSGINLPAYNGNAVYIITDHLTSRFYIGSTAEFENRLKTHIYIHYVQATIQTLKCKLHFQTILTVLHFPLCIDAQRKKRHASWRLLKFNHEMP